MMTENVVRFIDYIIVFFAGVGLSFTPCVFPLIPITISAITPRAQGSKSKGLLLSLIYVSGIATTYAILGLIAGLTGTLFGKISTHPISYVVVGIACIIFGLSMFDVVRLPLPRITTKGSSARTGFFSLFIFGMVAGLVVGPCTAPVLGSLLLYVGTRQNLFVASTLLLTFGYGVGFVLMLAGAFSGLLQGLPKAGRWMVWVKRFCGGALILFGISFLIKAGRLLI
ncbi:cytochrome c biogenesis protein CcdA [Candidatus Omnitrophota bacterium]